ncbi:MAG: hypothetical protein ACYSU0_15885 [Planctomycetota bacterium]|jgi:hypothetical protein
MPPCLLSSVGLCQCFFTEQFLPDTSSRSEVVPFLTQPETMRKPSWKIGVVMFSS